MTPTYPACGIKAAAAESSGRTARGKTRMQPCKANSAPLIGCPRPVFFRFSRSQGLKQRKQTAGLCLVWSVQKARRCLLEGFPQNERGQKIRHRRGRRAARTCFFAIILWFSLILPRHSILLIYSYFLHTYIHTFLPLHRLCIRGVSAKR